MTEDLLEGMYRLFGWRIASHVPHWDWEQLQARVTRWEDWLPEWTRWTEERWVGFGDEALAAGRRATAGRAYAQAGVFYHWATFLTVNEPGWVQALERMDEIWRLAAPLVDPPLERIDVPFEGTFLPGHLRKPAGVERPPLAVLVPGADSTKEELYDFSEHILRRGIATFAFDGPGHGLVSTRLKLRPDYEVPIRAVCDALLSRDDLDGGRLAVAGISYGGIFACRAAATDDRVKAVVSVSSWYTPAGRYETQVPISKAGLKQYMGDDPAAVQDALTVADVAGKITVPLLQVYGGSDPSSPPSHAERVAAEVQGPNELVVFPDGVHVCNNLAFQSRSLVADWLAEAL